MVITTFAVRKDTSKWMFVLLLTVAIFEICILFFLHWNHHFFDKIRSHHFPTAIRLGFLMLFQHILHL